MENEKKGDARGPDAMEGLCWAQWRKVEGERNFSCCAGAFQALGPSLWSGCKEHFPGTCRGTHECQHHLGSTKNVFVD
jgi:hypothetical protein